MKNKRLVALLTLLFGLTVQGSYAAFVKPKKCPSVGSIQVIQFIQAAKIFTGKWAAVQINQKYDTTQNWDFIIGTVDATDENDAMNQLYGALKSLRFVQGPEGSEERGWGCVYSAEEGKIEAAVTMPSQFGM